MSDLRPDDLARHALFLRRLALHLVGDPHAADDLTQETFAAALAAPRPPREGLRAWLGGVLRNRARMRFRTDARRTRRERVPRPRAAPATPEEMAIRLETQEAVARAVRALPEPYRTTIFLRFLDDRPAAEVARLTGVPASTVRSRQQKALELLRAHLDREHGGDRKAWSAALLPLVAGRRSLSAGVLVMSVKKMLIVLAVVAAGLLWFVQRDTGAPAGRATPGERETNATGASGAGTAPARDAGATPDAPAGTRTARAVDRDRDVFGEVVDGTGAPVAGATVASVFRPLRRSRSLVAERATIDGPRARTAADGAFRLTLERGQLVDLEITAAGFPPVTVPECQAGERVRVTLRRATPFRVVVRDADGSPVADAPVELRREAAGAAPVWTRKGTTGADGAYTFRDATPGPAVLVAGRPHECTVPGTLEVVWPSTRTVEGVVRDAETGAPIAGARVGRGWRVARAVTTDAHGRFALADWTGAWGRELHAVARGYGRLGLVVPPEGDVEFRLTRGDIAAGRVVDPAGRPVADAHVFALASRHTNEIQHIDAVHGRTDANGAFQLEDLRHDLPHTLVVEAAGHGKVLVDFVPAAQGPGRIELGTITMPRALRLEGRVVTGDGETVPPTPLTIELERKEEHVVGAYYGATEERRTDDLGRFRFPDLGPGDYELRVLYPGSRPLLARTVTLDADRTDVVLRVEAGRTLTVRVTDTDGKPVPGVMVDAGEPHAETGADGRVTLHGIADGLASVAIWPTRPSPDAERGFLPTRAPVQIDADGEMTVALRETRPIRGRVLGADGAPQPRLVVAAARAGTTTVVRTATCDDAGRFALFAEPGVALDLVVDGTRATRAGFGPVETIDVFGRTEGVTAPTDGVTIRTGAMPRDRALSVLVLDPDGKPVAGADVTVANARAYPYEDPDARVLRTDARGRARVTDLARRNVRVGIAPPGAETAAEAVIPPAQLVRPAGQTVTLRYERGERLAGVVVTADGNPAAGAEVRVFTMDGTPLATTTADASGAFLVRGRAGVAHGFYASLPSGDGRHYEVYLHDVKPGAGTSVRLELSRVAR